MAMRNSTNIPGSSIYQLANWIDL